MSQREPGRGRRTGTRHQSSGEGAGRPTGPWRASSPSRLATMAGLVVTVAGNLNGVSLPFVLWAHSRVLRFVVVLPFVPLTTRLRPALRLLDDGQWTPEQVPAARLSPGLHPGPSKRRLSHSPCGCFTESMRPGL